MSSKTEISLAQLDKAEIEYVSSWLSELPLMQRYGQSKHGLAEQLARAIDEQHLILAARLDNGQLPDGICWVVPRGAFWRSPYLKLLAVAAQAQGKGMGSCLLNAVEAELAAQPADLILLVSEDNKPAQAFYRARGYEQAGMLADYVVSGVNEVILKKQRLTSKGAPG